MTKLSEKLNFSNTHGSESAIEIKKWHDVNHSETLSKYIADNNITLSGVGEAEFDGCVILMQDHGQADKSTDTYFFWIDTE